MKTIAGIASIIVCWLCPVSLSYAQSKTILVVESYHGEYLWDASYKEGLQEVLGKDYSLVFHEMNTKRLPKSEHQKMADGAWAKYQELKPVLVILGDDAALKLLGPRFAPEKIPVVFLGINANPRNYFQSFPSNLTGVLERPIFKRSIMYIQEIFPKAKRGLVLFDTDLTAQAVKEEAFSGKDNANLSGVQVDIKLIGTLDEWKSAVTSSKGQYDFIITGLYQTIKDGGKPVDAEDVIKWTSVNSPIPPFAFWDFAVGSDKVIGGLVLYGKDMGLKTGELAKKVLAGTPPSQIPFQQDTQGVFLFSKKQLAKWRIDLPADIKAAATLME